MKFTRLASCLASCLAFVGFAACGRPGSSEHHADVAISGGRSASDGAPKVVNGSVVAFAANSDFYHPQHNARSANCSGVVVGESVVLTAAHCAQDPDKAGWLVVFSGDMRSARDNAAARVRQVKRVVKHPGFPDYEADAAGNRVTRNDYIAAPEKWLADNPGKAPNDLALVQFEGTLPEGYAPVPLAREGDFATVTLAGFGITRSTNIDDGGVLRFVEGVKAKAPDADARSRHFVLAAETIDVEDQSKGALPRGACPGDSGGPAFVEGSQSGRELALAGILSLGELERLSGDSLWGYCLGHKAGGKVRDGNVYTDVRPYAAWIEETKKAFGSR